MEEAAQTEEAEGLPLVDPEPAQEPEEALPPPPPPPIVTATQWRRVTQRRYRLWLPSQNVVIAKRIDTAALLMNGTVTQEDAVKLLVGAPTKDELVSRVAVCRKVLSEIVCEPLVVQPDDPRALDPEVMCTEDVPPADVLALVAWALGVLNTVASEPLDDE